MKYTIWIHLFVVLSGFSFPGKAQNAPLFYKIDTSLFSQIENLKRQAELIQDTLPPKIVIQEPALSADSTIHAALNKKSILLRGKVTGESELKQITVNNNPVTFIHIGEDFEFSANVDLFSVDYITIIATDTCDNILSNTYFIIRTEIDPPVITIMEPYASDNGEIYLDTRDTTLYIEGSIHDESTIRSIVLDGVSSSFIIGNMNPRFSATLNLAGKDTFHVTATDIYGNDTTQVFTLNRGGVSLNEGNPMGRTWVIFIENSNYEAFPSLNGPARDVTLIRTSLTRYDIHKIIHKQDMTKKEMERFFSLELRDLLLSNKVNTLLVWYAGHGRFIDETGYWIPVDARRDDEFTYYNLNALRASLQSYTNYIKHNLVITDACEPGPAFYQAIGEIPGERNCSDQEALQLKSSQVVSSSGYELEMDDSRFTRDFANVLDNNPGACLPIETIINKVTLTLSQNYQQMLKFGKIRGLGDENGTFLFIPRN